jgi:hypothetical protein
VQLASAEATLALDLERFQFPSATDPSDAAWLIVVGDVSSAGRHWRFRDPCLDLFEVRRLASWLDQVCTRQPPAPLGLTEPNLAFELRSASDASLVIRVFFELEVRPRWAHEGFVDNQDHDCVIDLDVSTASVMAASRDLLRQLDKLETGRSIGSATTDQGGAP